MKTVCAVLLLVCSSFAHPWRQQPDNRSPSQQPEYGSRGTWDVKASRDQRGPQVRLEGEGNIYKNGQFSIDGRGHHEFGKGRKPETEVFIEGKYRFRRDVQSEDNINLEDEVQENIESTRVRRSPFREGERQFPGQNQEKKGSWDVSATRDERGPQIKAQGEANVYSKGNSRVDVGGQWEAGRGRKPSYGATVKGRWRRDLGQMPDEYVVEHDEDKEGSRVRRSPFMEGERQLPGQNQNQNQDKGSWGVTVHRDERGPQVRVEGEKNIYRDGQLSIDARGHHEFGRGRKPETGVYIEGKYRFRRDLQNEDNVDTEVLENIESSRVRRSPFREGERQIPEPNQNQDKGSWGVIVNRDERGPQVRVEGERNIYRDGQLSIDARGHHEFGRGRKPETGVYIEGKYRFRRDLQNEDDVDSEVLENIESSRVRRSPFREGERQFPGQNQDKKGSWDVSATRDERGPQIKAQGEANVYSKGNSRVDVGGQWEAGRGRKPSYGATVKGRWRRNLGEMKDDDELYDVLSLSESEERGMRVVRDSDGPKTTVGSTVSGQQSSGSSATAYVDVVRKLWESRDGRSSLTSTKKAQYDAQGKPQHVRGITFSHSW